MKRLALAAVVPALVASASASFATEKSAAKGPKITYNDNVRPIFRDKCFACHNTEKKTAGLDLTSFAGVMAGGGSGAVIQPGSAGDSYLFSLVTHSSEPHMPPKSDKLPADLLSTIEKWIDGGALENSGSKAIASSKPKVDLSLKSTSAGRPDGPPPMPGLLSLEPIVRASRSTAPRTVATSPWAPLAAVPGQKQVLLYNTKTLELAGVLPFPEGVPYILKFSPSGQLLLAGGGHSSANGRVVVWNVKTGERVFEVGDELDAVLAADISADQSLIALGGPGKVVRVYSTSDGSLKFTMKKHTDWIYSAAFSPDGVLLATADRNGGIVVWEAQTGREFLVLGGHSSAVTGLSWRIDSNVLASASEDTTIKLWEMENGSQVKSWGAHGGGVTGIDFTRDGRLVSCGRDRLAKLWDQKGAAKTNYSGFADLPLCVAYCDETNRLIAGDWTGEIRVFDATSGKQIGLIDANPPRLVERLDDASKRLASEQAVHKDIEKRFAAAQAASAVRRKEITTAQAEARRVAAAYQAAATEAQQAEQAASTLMTADDAANKTVQSLESLIAALREAADKSSQAAAKLVGDKEIAQAAERLKMLHARKKAELEQAKSAAPQRMAKLAIAKRTADAARKRAAELKAALATAEKRAVDPADLAKQTLEQSARRVALVQEEVNRWRAEIAYRDKSLALAALQTKASQLAEAAQAAQAAFDAAKTDVIKLQRKATEAQGAVDVAAAEVKRSNDLVQSLATEQSAALRRGSLLDLLIPALNETVVKAEEALGRAPGDPDVTAQVGQLKSLIAKKTSELEAVKKAVVEKGNGLASAKSHVPDAEKRLRDARAALEVAKRKAAAAQAALKPLDEKRKAAQAATVDEAKRLEAAQREVDSVKLHRSA